MATAPVNGIQLYYEVNGPALGTAPVIVFAHGAGGNHLSWWQQVPHFQDRYTCITFDHRGFGQSRDVTDGPGWSAYTGDLLALLDHLGVQQTNLVAQSMGGWTCLGLALAHPERVLKLVMADTHGGASGPEIPARTPAPPADRATGYHPAVAADYRRTNPTMNFLYWQISDLNGESDLRRGVAAAPTPTTASLRGLAVPTMFIIGEEDVVIPPAVIEAAAACIPNARVEHVAGAGHSVYFEAPAAFNALVADFLGD
ncbi:MAG: alpha/beta fold hydrolase [Dehalococcoidia bacterium]